MVVWYNGKSSGVVRSLCWESFLYHLLTVKPNHPLLFWNVKRKPLQSYNSKVVKLLFVFPAVLMYRQCINSRAGSGGFGCLVWNALIFLLIILFHILVIAPLLPLLPHPFPSFAPFKSAPSPCSLMKGPASHGHQQSVAYHIAIRPSISPCIQADQGNPVSGYVPKSQPKYEEQSCSHS